MEAKFSAAEGPAPALVGLLVDYLHYVDRCHNHKEELHLFPKLEAKGMPRHGGPLGVMLQEHERGAADPVAPRAAGDRVRRRRQAGAGAAARRLRRVRVTVHGPLLEGERHPLPDGAADAGRGRGGGSRRRHRGGRGLARRWHARALLPDRAGDRRPGRAARPVVRAGARRAAADPEHPAVELSFIDREDRVRYFSHEHGEKIFAAHAARSARRCRTAIRRRACT